MKRKSVPIHLIALGVALGVVLVPALGRAPVAAEVARPMLKTLEPAELCLMPPRTGAYQTAGRGRSQPAAVPLNGPPPGWPGKETLGGNVPAVRVVHDPHPTFNGMAIDPENDVVVFSDENQEGLLSYDLTAGGHGKQTTEPKHHILGSKVNLG